MNAVPGADGRFRCTWAVGSEDYQRYHDQEWGRPISGQSALFERLSLEAFQAGLSWLTILRKRDAFRAAFCGFEPVKVALFTDDDVARLMANARIVRNRAKILATIANARAIVELPAGENLQDIIEAHRPVAGRAPERMEDIPAATDESRALAKDLKQHGLRFVGPTTAYATMQAIGLVNDHLAGCWVRAGV